MAICMQLMNYDINVNSGQNLEMIRQHAILLPSCFLFFALYCIFSKKQVTEKKGKILTEMSASVFGIFLIETHTVYSLKIYEAVAVLIPNAGIIFMQYSVYYGTSGIIWSGYFCIAKNTYSTESVIKRYMGRHE